VLEGLPTKQFNFGKIIVLMIVKPVEPYWEEFDDLDGNAMGTASRCPHLKSAACPK
jgi:hypothetical protein